MAFDGRFESGCPNCGGDADCTVDERPNNYSARGLGNDVQFSWLELFRRPEVS